jgi:hypothetical protein
MTYVKTLLALQLRSRTTDYFRRQIRGENRVARIQQIQRPCGDVAVADELQAFEAAWGLLRGIKRSRPFNGIWIFAKTSSQPA